jgi:hypothetical protein
MTSFKAEGQEAFKSHLWRTIDLGHHSIRWLDVIYQSKPNAQNEDENIESTVVDQGKALTLDRLALCELESLHTKLLPSQSYLDRKLAFPEWKSIDSLASSPHLGAPTAFEKQDGKLWINTPDGEYVPSTLFSRWMSEVLTPPKVIGEETTKKNQSLVWLNSSSQLPSVAALTYRCLSELPYTHGASLNRSIATLIGVGQTRKDHVKKGIWGVLDIGISQGSWSLIEVNDSHVPQHLTYKMLKTYGRSFIGERGLRRTLLNHHLQKSQMSWSELEAKQRLEWLDYISLQADTLLRRSWPKLLDTSGMVSESHVQVDETLYELFQRYHHGTYQGVLSWINHSLQSSNIGPEALRGIYVTGKHALGVSVPLRRILSAVNVRVAPFEIELEGAQRYVETMLYREGLGYYIEEVTPFALIFRDDEEGLTKEIFSEQSEVPCMHEIDIGPTKGKVSLWLSSYGDVEQKLAEHPAVSEKLTLQIYYEGPHLFELNWRTASGKKPDNHWSTV